MGNRVRWTVKIVALLVLFSDFLVVGTISYYKKIETKTNSFIIGTVIPKVIETFDTDNNKKENIHIYNDGNFPIYIRVIPVYYFKNNNGELIDDVPVVDNDYSIIFSSSANWIKGNDGYYYYKTLLEPGKKTDNLIEECLEINSSDEKTFFIDVVAQAIQALPTKAVEEAWGITIIDNVIQIN